MHLVERRWSGLLVLALVVGACGEPDDARATAADVAESAPPITQRASSAPPAGTLDRAGFINAFTLRADGTVDETWKGDTLQLSGGCTPGAPLSIGFRSGTLASENYLYLGFDTQKPIGPGETGTFPVREIRWDRGTSRNDRGARVPQRYSGTGTLTLTTHRAKVGDQRLSGTLTGEKLTGPGAASVDLMVEFDINRSCGISG